MQNSKVTPEENVLMASNSYEEPRMPGYSAKRQRDTYTVASSQQNYLD